jgi:CRISPR-associated protein Csd1
MLEALYKYAIDHELTARPGFKHKNVKYYISFSFLGDFIGFEPVAKGTPPPLCPDIGENNTQGDKCNFLVVKAEILLNIQTDKSGANLQKKHDFYFDLMKQASEHDELFRIAYNGLNYYLETIKETFFQLCPKPNKNDILSIKVDNKALESLHEYQDWWIGYYNNLNRQNKGKVRCLITGELIDATDIIDKLNTALPSSADYKSYSRAKLICFDKDAFQSYGLEKSFNAPVSKEAITIVNSALDDLLQKNVHSIPGAKHIYWYSADVPEDIIELPFYNFGNDPNDSDDEEKKQEDLNRVEKMFDSINKHVKATNCPKNKYYMMSLCAYKTRIIIQSYDEGTYDELWKNIQLWFSDICISISGVGKTYCSLFSFQKCLLKKVGKSEEPKKIAERMNEELSGIAPRIVYSIYHGTQLPNAVAVKALAYIRSDMYSGDEDSGSKSLIPDKTACQILKAWLNRKYRIQKKEEYLIMDKLNNDSPSVAYQTGRLMAVYALIQYAALGDVGAGVVERYYTSACSSPALVMGKLATMSQYHLSKLKSDNPGAYVNYNKMLEEISLKIGDSLPKTFDLKQQSEFALGYYFQRSQRYTNKKTEG